MSFSTLLIQAAERHVELPMPTWLYAAIAALFFIIAGVATFSYRDVANRHPQKWQDADHGAHGHGGGH